MSAFPVGHQPFWDDAYAGECYPSFALLWVDAQEYWLGQYAPLNWPVWVEYDASNERNWDVGPTVEVGIFLPRHGACTIWSAPATPAQAQQLREITLQVWAIRADMQFARHAPVQMETAQRE